MMTCGTCGTTSRSDHRPFHTCQYKPDHAEYTPQRVPAFASLDHESKNWLDSRNLTMSPVQVGSSSPSFQGHATCRNTTSKLDLPAGTPSCTVHLAQRNIMFGWVCPVLRPGNTNQQSARIFYTGENPDSPFTVRATRPSLLLHFSQQSDTCSSIFANKSMISFHFHVKYMLIE